MKVSLVSAVLVCVILISTTLAADKDLILNLPGLKKQPSFQQYSGYLEATGGRHLHYWFVECQKDPKTAPLVLWMNGGPGCSSLLATLTEHGPFTIQDDTSLEYNPYSWNMFTNMLYLEAPAGVGFSYSNDQNYTTDDDQVSLDNLAAVKSFFKKFPEYKGRDFYVSGESYGGIYVPTLSVRLLDEPSINFQGFAIGNGLSDYHINAASILYFGYYHGLFGSDLYGELLKACCGSNTTICRLSSLPSDICKTIATKALTYIYNSYLNMYNVYSECKSTAMNKDYIQFHEFGNSFQDFPIMQKLKQQLLMKDRKKLKLVPPCINGTAALVYLNRAEVRKALHIPDKVHNWELCSTDVSLHYQRTYTTMKPLYQKVIAAKKRIMLYNGDIDMACNFLGDEWFINSLNLPVVSPRKAWIYKSGDSSLQVGGYVKGFTNVTFVTVRGAGHMVPTDKPIPAYIIFWNFIKNNVFKTQEMST